MVPSRNLSVMKHFLGRRVLELEFVSLGLNIAIVNIKLILFACIQN
jgi:hypothetical protein